MRLARLTSVTSHAGICHGCPHLMSECRCSASSRRRLPSILWSRFNWWRPTSDAACRAPLVVFRHHTSMQPAWCATKSASLTSAGYVLRANSLCNGGVGDMGPQSPKGRSPNKIGARRGANFRSRIRPGPQTPARRVNTRPVAPIRGFRATPLPHFGAVSPTPLVRRVFPRSWPPPTRTPSIHRR